MKIPRKPADDVPGGRNFAVGGHLCQGCWCADGIIVDLRRSCLPGLRENGKTSALLKVLHIFQYIRQPFENGVTSAIMSLGLHERRARRRRKFWLAVAKWTFALLMILAAGGYAYYAGENLARREVDRLEDEIQVLQDERTRLEEERALLEEQIRTAVTRAKEWESQYRRDVPTGEMQTFLGLVDKKMQSGLSAERLAFLIEQASEPTDCVDDPDTKRFLVRTPLQKGANDSVSFDGITITASGESAVNDNGQVEAWFDIDKPLTLAFTQLGGEANTKSGLLPLHHALIVQDKEYRFTLTAGPRGFVLVTGQRCAYP
jgi:cell division protein FtsB